jgi:hypothetical protein
MREGTCVQYRFRSMQDRHSYSQRPTVQGVHPVGVDEAGEV